MKIDFSLTGNVCQYFIVLLLTLAAIGVLYPVMSYTLASQDKDGNYSHTVSSSVGAGVILVSTCGGIGMAFFFRRRDAIKVRRTKN